MRAVQLDVVPCSDPGCDGHGYGKQRPATRWDPSYWDGDEECPVCGEPLDWENAEPYEPEPPEPEFWDDDAPGDVW